MIQIQQIRDNQNKILVLGNHESLIQSVLDFDYLSDKKEGSIVGIVTGRRGFAKYFFGRREILIPTLTGVSRAGDLSNAQVGTAKLEGVSRKVNFWFLNLLSGRRTLSSTMELLQLEDSSSIGDLAKGQVGTAKLGGESSRVLNFAGAALFAENVPELHSLQIINSVSLCHGGTATSPHRGALVVGPASVGLLVPGSLKLGPIGGITPDQIFEGKITEPGSVAVMSASGGMTNELINIATQAGHRLSFALSFGGDRFPVLSPRDAFLLAESDPQTKTILYYGELGGEDEYELVKLKEEGKFTKPVIAHIAGTVSSLFPESPQFGHAKAKSDKERTTALAKRAALKAAGFSVSSSFSEFINLVAALGSDLR
jgi:succinyl-CoA synthetase alpha subunit